MADPARQAMRPGPAAAAGAWLLLAMATAQAQTLANPVSGDPAVAAEERSIELNGIARLAFERGDLEAAMENYRQSLAAVERSAGVGSPLLITPLAGLADVLIATQREPEAIGFLMRAISVSRRHYGLFAAEQLPLIDRLSDCHEAVGDQAGIIAQRQYALAIAEHQFGSDDAGVLPPIRRLAGLYESLGLHAEARGLYERIRRIGEAESTAGSAFTIEGLLGIGRSHRREFVDSPTSLHAEWVRDPVTGNRIPYLSLEPYQSPRPRREGPKATARALKLLREVSDPPVPLLAEALIEMGDWAIILNRGDDAMAYYAEAWALHAGPLADLPNPLSRPRLVLYRAPSASRRTANSVPGDIVVEHAAFRLTVDASGLPKSIRLVETDTSERRIELLLRALESARFSPRFENGRPAPTDEYEFEGHWEALAPDS